VKLTLRFLSTKIQRIKVWQTFRGRFSSHFKVVPSEVAELGLVAMTSLVTIGLVLGARQMSWIQPLELYAYDKMVQLPSRDRGLDDRLLIVGITEDDINYFVRKWPIPDQTIAEALAKLQQLHPKVIGLDMWRNIPIGSSQDHQALLQQFQQNNVFVISLVGQTPPPDNAEHYKQRIGANNVLIDPDGVLRRHYLFATSTDPRYARFAEDGIFYALSLRLALAYLAHYQIYPNSSPENPSHLQLGKAVFLPLQANDGGYQNIDAAKNPEDVGGYQFLVDYRSGKGVAPQISLQQLWEGKKADGQPIAPLVKDKIVLIGAIAESAKDLQLTPYSTGNTSEKARMPGVMVHATATSQILDAALGKRQLFWFWPEWAEILWVAGWILVGGSLGWWIRHPAGLLVGGVTAMSMLVSVTLWLFTQQGWIPLAAPSLGSVLLGTTLVIYRAYQAQQQRQMVMTLLGQNTSDAIAQALWNGRDILLKAGKIPGQKLIATIVFTDLVGFSTLAEQFSPEFLLEWLNEYLAMLSQEVQTHDGIVNKFTGDGIMAVFGVPVARNTASEIAVDAINAVSSALAMCDRLQALNSQWQTRSQPIAKMRVGIYTGPVIVGSLGSQTRLEYGVIGDSVNIASRLESFEKERQVDDCRILIAEETLQHLRDRFHVEPWGLITFKGRQKAVNVYRVMGSQ
jgi:CHASE2 domain-containing sensor protein/class 3 adenylate cyclase